MKRDTSLKEEYLKFCLRLDKHLKPLLKHYFGPTSVKKFVEKEEPVPLKELKKCCLILQKEIENSSDYDFYHKKYLLAQLKSYETLIRDRLGEEVSHREFIKYVYGIEIRKISNEEIEVFHKRLKALLRERGYGGNLVSMLRSWFNDHAFEGRKMLKVFRDEIKKAKEKTFCLVNLPPGTPEVNVRGVYDVPYRMMADVLRDKPEIKVNLAYKITPSDLKILACHEVYPGHYTHLIFLRKLYFQNPEYLEFSYFSTFTPFVPIIEGVGEMAYFFIYRAPTHIDEKINRLVQDLVKMCFINSDLLYWEEGKSGDEIVKFLENKALFPPENIPNKMKWIKSETLKGYDSVYWTGSKLIRKYFQEAKVLGREKEFFDVVYKEMLTPEILESRMAAILGGEPRIGSNGE